MDWQFGDESHSDSFTEGGDNVQDNPSDISEKDISAKKSEVWGNHFSVEEGSWKCGACMVLNQKGGTKCAASETEQLVNERKLDVSVGADGSEALAYSRIRAGSFKFGELRLQGHPDGSSVSTIFEDLFTEEETGA